MFAVGVIVLCMVLVGVYFLAENYLKSSDDDSDDDSTQN